MSRENIDKENLLQMYNRGYDMYEKGDLSGAFSIIDEAAKFDQTEAQALLGVMYFRGEGVRKNFEIGKYWTERAAHKGNPVAMYNLATCFLNGKGCSVDEDEAIKWLKKAQNSGVRKAGEILEALENGKKVYLSES